MKFVSEIANVRRLFIIIITYCDYYCYYTICSTRRRQSSRTINKRLIATISRHGVCVWVCTPSWRIYNSASRTGVASRPQLWTTRAKPCRTVCP